MIQFELLKQILEFWKNSIHHCEFDTFTILTGFSDEIGEDIHR